MEERDLYDGNKQLTGISYLKGEKIPDGLYALVVLIFIENSNGEFLMQLRSEEKGGKWASTGGHPKKGETSRRGIITEVFEEIGIDIANMNFQHFNTFTNNGRICDLYYLKADINSNDTKLQKEEVEDIKWFSREQIEELNNNGNFHPTHYIMYKMCLDYLD